MRDRPYNPYAFSGNVLARRLFIPIILVGMGGCASAPEDPTQPVQDWYQQCVLDPDYRWQSFGKPVGQKGISNQHLDRQLYCSAGRGDAAQVRACAAQGGDVNVRLFRLINHYDGSNGQPSGNGVPLSKHPYRPGAYIDQRGDWNKCRIGRAGAFATHANPEPHETPLAALLSLVDPGLGPVGQLGPIGQLGL